MASVNLANIWSLTSWIMPRPNCASTPTTLTSEVTVTSVSPGARSTTRLFMRMSAPPLPRVSCPEAAISASPDSRSSRSNRSLPR